MGVETWSDYNQGVADGMIARTTATKLGIAPDQPIYPQVDRALGHPGRIEEYLRGFAEGAKSHSGEET